MGVGEVGDDVVVDGVVDDVAVVVVLASSLTTYKQQTNY